MLRLLCLVAAGAALGACGNANVLHPTTPASSCQVSGFHVAPADGAGPLHRLTPLAISWKGDAGTVAFDVTAAGEPVKGEKYVDEGRAIFIPVGALPASTVVRWSITACKTTQTGSFTTGALLHPLDDVDAAVGQPWELDLRRGRLDEPKPDNTVGGFLFKWKLAPSFLVEMRSIEGNIATFMLAPAIRNAKGELRPDNAKPAQVMRASLENNPYVALDPNDFEVALQGGAITLRNVELVVGLNDSGLTDGRIVAEVDTRTATPIANACESVAATTGGGCYKCDAKDWGKSCFLLEMSNLVGLPTEARLGTPAPGLPGVPPTIPGIEDQLQTPAMPIPDVRPAQPCVDPLTCNEQLPIPPIPAPARP